MRALDESLNPSRLSSCAGSHLRCRGHSDSISVVSEHHVLPPWLLLASALTALLALVPPASPLVLTHAHSHP